MGQIITDSIVSEIKDAKIFSILAEEVTDCSNQEQLCLCFRFVDREGSVREEFIDFLHCERITGEILTNNILGILSRCGLDVDNVRGQGYDGAANMSSMRKGVAGRILEKNDLAIYSHCSSHKLNLAIVSSCSIPIIKHSSDVMGKTARFFSNSPKKETFLLEIIESECPDRRKKKLKDVCRTRWVERHEAFSTMLELYEVIVGTLETMICRSDFDDKSRSEALGLMKSLKSADYIISCLVINKALALLQPISIKLQGVAVDVVVANEMVNSVIAELKLFDDTTFDEIFENAVSLANSVGESISAPRVTALQKNRANPPVETALEYFRITIFKPFMNHLLGELDSRFTDNRQIVNKLCRLIPPCAATGDDLKELEAFYYGDLPSPGLLASEFRRWKSVSEDRSPMNTSKALRLCDEDIYPNVHQLIKTLLTIPVTTAEVERGNSKLRLLKTRLRSVMSQDRLSSLALLFIHNEFKLDYKEVVQRFANQRPRRMNIEMSLWDKE